MNARDDAIRRILVALDASPESLAALEYAADLAAGLQAELTGIFVEDVDLLNLAGMPFAREVSALTPGGRQLDPDAMATALHAQAARARQALETAATGLHLRWSFRVLRGRIEAELQTAVAETDLLALGRRAQSVRRRILGRTLETMARRLPSSVLLAVPGHRTAIAPVAAIYDVSDCGGRALSLGARIAGEARRDLIVYLMAESAGDFAEKRKHAENRLGGDLARVRFIHVPGYGPGDLEPALLRDDPHMLVVGCDVAGGMPPETWMELASRANCPVLLLRGLL
ncbi:MAG: universal stress protein [Dongiaceae bacterium]